MRDMLIKASILAAMALGSTAALAQSQSGTPASSSSQSTQPSSNATPKAMSQDRARQIMKDAGFTNVQILDATYLVQASTKDGDQILMVLNPPAMSRSGVPATTGAAGASSGSSPGTPAGANTTAPKQ